MTEQAVRLSGDLVALEPLAPEHEGGLFEAAQDPQVWTWISRGYPAESAASFHRLFFAPALAAAVGGEEVPRAGIGAQFEGVLRKHRIVPGVGQRDSAYFSVIDDEWPAVRERLRARLDA